MLLVDDDLDTLDLERLVLEGAGATVACASSVDAALQEHRRRPAAIIVSDLAMPEQDGFALARTLRAAVASGAVAVPLLALSAHASASSRQHALAAGFDSFLTKPVHPGVLVDAVVSLLARKDGPKPR